MAFVTGQAFVETPNGIVTDFTTLLEFVGDILVTQGGLVAHNFEALSASSIRFDTAPIAANGDILWSGYTSTVGVEDEYMVGIAQRIQDDEERLTSAILQDCLAQALAEYNRRRPNTAIVEQTGDGTVFMDVPGAWETDFSDLLRLEVLDSLDVPSEIRRQRYRLVEDQAAALKIYREYGYFTSGSTFRLTYSVAHTITAESSSVPSEDGGALMALASSLACTRLAAAYAQSTDPQIGTVVVDYKSKTSEYRTLAKDYMTEFERALTSKESMQGRGRMKTWRRDSPLFLKP